MLRKICTFLLFLVLILASIYGIAVFFVTRQIEILLLFCIVGATFCVWGAWYSFLKKQRIMFFALVVCLIILLCLSLMTIMDVTSPDLIQF